MTDPVALVEDAQSKDKFDVLAAAKGLSYPEDDVTVYTDVVSVYALHKAEAEIAAATDDDEVNALDTKKNELREAIKGSALTFHLRGIAPGHIQALMDVGRSKFPDVEGEDYNTDRANWFEGQIIAEHIVSVENASGAVDDRKWTADEIIELKGAIHEESFTKLLEGVNKLSFAAAYFDLAVDADF